jgi:Kef-type K+ transport system membrane component KefB
MFVWFYPFFFVGTGVHLDLSSLLEDWKAALAVPLFSVQFLLVRGAPVIFYRKDLAAGQQLPFALSSAIPSVSIMVVITQIGVKSGSVSSHAAAALVAAGLLSVLLYPTITGMLMRSGGQ